MRFYLLLAIILVFPFKAMGIDNFIIKFQLKDAETERPLMGHLDLFPLNDRGLPELPQLSNLDFGVDGVIAEKFVGKPSIRMRACYQVYSKYIYEVGSKRGVVSEDYAPKYIDFEIPDSASSPFVQILYVHRENKTKELNEVTVTASKVMFYHKGDTIIYNADAFVLNEGSSIDALISKLPGVKLNPSGVITVNGRIVETLMLNGKNMFNEAQAVIPVHMLKSI